MAFIPEHKEEPNENKANSYHERKSANDEKKVIVLNLSLRTLGERYCGQQERQTWPSHIEDYPCQHRQEMGP